MNVKASEITGRMGLSELQAAYERQKRLMSNKKFLEKLPDKGLKIRESCATLERRINELKQLAELQTPAVGLSEMFSSLSVSNTNKVDINEMEWTGKVPQSPNIPYPEARKSEDSEEEKDIVNILATTNQLSKIVIDERCKTPETDETSTPQKVTPSKISKVLEHANMLHKTDNTFKPFRSLKHEKVCKGTYFKENTAATPPIYKLDHAMPLPLEESLAIQQNVVDKMKALEIQRFGLPANQRKTKIQTNPDFGRIHSDEEDEVYDDEGGREEGTIVVQLSA